MLLVILLLEVIREAGLRMPQSLGHSVSLVAALILGDAAIATGLMSTPVIFVASITSIAVFVTPALYEPATLLRIGVVVAAGLAGPVGLAGAFFVLLLSLSGTGMLGVPYLAQHPFPQSPLAEDGVIRRNYRHLCSPASFVDASSCRLTCRLCFTTWPLCPMFMSAWVRPSEASLRPKVP